MTGINSEHLFLEIWSKLQLGAEKKAPQETEFVKANLPLVEKIKNCVETLSGEESQTKKIVGLSKLSKRLRNLTQKTEAKEGAIARLKSATQAFESQACKKLNDTLKKLPIARFLALNSQERQQITQQIDEETRREVIDRICVELEKTTSSEENPHRSLESLLMFVAIIADNSHPFNTLFGNAYNSAFKGIEKYLSGSPDRTLNINLATIPAVPKGVSMEDVQNIFLVPRVLKQLDRHPKESAKLFTKINTSKEKLIKARFRPANTLNPGDHLPFLVCKEILELTFSELKDINAWIKEVKKFLPTGTSESYKTIQSSKILSALLAAGKTVRFVESYRILTESQQRFERSKNPNKVISSLILDKIKYRRPWYDGGHTFVTLFILIEEIRKTIARQIPSWSKNLSKNTAQILGDFLSRELLPTLEKCVPLSYVFNNLKDSPSLSEAGKAVVNSIKCLSIDEKRLIPCGYSTHAMGLLVHRTGKDAASLTIYNTGRGVRKFHVRFKNALKYQTFFTIENVPFNQLIDSDLWKTYAELKARGKSADHVYAFFKKRLGKGGKVLPPSKHIEDCTLPQKSGSCAYLWVLTFLRHQMLGLKVGSKGERLALYKHLKATMLHSYTIENLNQTDELTQKAAKSKLSKLSNDLNLFQCCSNPDTGYEKTKLALQNALNTTAKEELKSLAHALKRFDGKETLAKYQVLRAASSALAKHWSLNPGDTKELRNEDKKHLGFAIARDEHHREIYRLNIEDRLKHKDEHAQRTVKYFQEAPKKDLLFYLAGTLQTIKKGDDYIYLTCFVLDLLLKNLNKEQTNTILEFYDSQEFDKLPDKLKKTLLHEATLTKNTTLIKKFSENK